MKHVNVDIRPAARWTLTPLGWIVVFLAALFLAGFCCGVWFGR